MATAGVTGLDGVGVAMVDLAGAETGVTGLVGVDVGLGVVGLVGVMAGLGVTAVEVDTSIDLAVAVLLSCFVASCCFDTVF